MKKRNGKIDFEIGTINSSDFPAPELLEQFLRAKEALNLSRFTLKLYRQHCILFIESLNIEELYEPAWKSCTIDNYYKFIIKLQQSSMLDISVATACMTFIEPFKSKIAK